MSDFYSAFWDYYVAILAVASILGCAVFLKLQSSRKVVVKDSGEADTTDHVWDGDLREYHNPMPRWWIWLFYLTIAFAVVYLVLFPGLGTQYKGTLNWTSVGQLDGEMQAANAKYGPLLAAYLKQDLPAVAADAHGRQIGERIFLNNCAQCHGSDARGMRGFPNLTHPAKRWGSTPEALVATITNGREALMPPMAAAIGGVDDVTDVANYVQSLSNATHDAARALRGREKFAVCAACHGAEGKGNPVLGAPDLTAGNWLYGGSVAAIVETVTKGRHGVMPAHKDVLSAAEIHLVAGYVYSLTPPAK